LKKKKKNGKKVAQPASFFIRNSPNELNVSRHTMKGFGS
jgi:hypothetical protein